MKPIDLIKIRTGFKGKPFYQLIEYHLNKQSQDKRIQGIHGIMSMLPKELQNPMVDFIDHCNIKVYDKIFWSMDTSDVFDNITNDAKNFFSHDSSRFDDETLFNIFNIVVLTYAYSAYDQPKMQEFMGIKESKFPWLSAITLLYPISLIIVLTQTSASIPMIIGYVVANLGYALFVAGIATGTFRIFGLTKRSHVLAMAVIAIFIGLFLSNLEVVNHLIQHCIP